MSAGPSLLHDDAWQRRVFVTLTPLDGSDVEFAAEFNDIGFGGATKDFDSEPMMNGGRTRVVSAEEDHEFEGTLYPIGVDADSARGLAQYLHGGLVSGTPSLDTISQDSSSVSAVSQVESQLQRTDVRLAVLWTNDTSVTSATGSVGPGSDLQAYRMVYEDCNVIEVTPSFDDKVLTADISMKVPPFDPEGNARVAEQEYTGDSSDSLEALGSYTSS